MATIRFVLLTLTRWAQVKQFGEIRIVVQAGQIAFVHKNASYAGELPAIAPDEADEVAEIVQQVGDGLEGGNR